MVKRLLLLSSLVFLMFGCTDPITEHNKDVIRTINDAKKVTRRENASGYIMAVQNAYSEYIGQNGVPPTLNDFYVNYQTNACNNDRNSSDYALRVENGYLHIYCTDSSYTQDTMKMREE